MIEIPLKDLSPEHAKLLIGAKSTAHYIFDPLLQYVSPETAIFIIIITAFTLKFHLKFSPQVAYSAPAILTTLGILGTFVGMALGLMDFDVSNIEQSVPSLIDGVKTAVWASAWGIFCALTIKLRETIFGISSKYLVSDNYGVTIEDLAKSLSSIQMSMMGNDQTDLITHLQMAHKETKERLDKMNNTLETYLARTESKP